jgi:hypothetical protein
MEEKLAYSRRGFKSQNNKISTGKSLSEDGFKIYRSATSGYDKFCIPYEDVSEYLVYPFPAVNQLTISISKKLPVDYKLYDLEGKILNEGTLTYKECVIDISKFITGIYIIKFFEDGKVVYSCKAVKI